MMVINRFSNVLHPYMNNSSLVNEDDLIDKGRNQVGLNQLNQVGSIDISRVSMANSMKDEDDLMDLDLSGQELPKNAQIMLITTGRRVMVEILMDQPE